MSGAFTANLQLILLLWG